MVENGKQVRVDNWGIFFLQRLQLFFSKTDYCDLTLQFEGNVQLKVHRLVMNACTEYFTFLEQSCPALEESTILMPADLQADVIVPIVNFMYTGMLEFHPQIFEKLFKAAELMNITVLTKLLEAQVTTVNPLKKPRNPPHTWNLQGKKIQAKTATDLPATLPGRKLPVWKRKNVPSTHSASPTTAHPVSSTFSESKWHTPDPLAVPDNTPKPTRFEWPDDDLPPVNLMDTNFDISYNSKPLLTKEDVQRAGTSFDDVKNTAVSNRKMSSRSNSTSNVDIRDVEDYVKEHKIRSDLTANEEEINEPGQKRKLDNGGVKQSPKRIKVSEKENNETTISIKSNSIGDLDHTKIVSEILKKYPGLVKKNKSIKLKIMASGNKGSSPEQTKTQTVQIVNKARGKAQVANAHTEKEIKTEPPAKIALQDKNQSEEGPWVCPYCSGDELQEFVLYYLYRKHMTDLHDEKFDARMCKYCGRMCENHNGMMYHLYTKHGLKPPSSYNFPKCDQCPYIAISVERLQQHKQHHELDEIQCVNCQLAFSSAQMFTQHMQITGHHNKTNENMWGCQYCVKKLTSANGLFEHIKSDHYKEGMNDGIVSLNETLEMDDGEKEGNEEEYIVPEVLPQHQKDKVKIISNVKVPMQQGEEAVPAANLEPSSEAEALSNVASGIATSLGLVDIVVLDDNQQYILQQQQNQAGETEFILPDLTTGGGTFNSQVITSQHSTVLPQGMLQTTGADINSTDELVMVLTDHDYQDEQNQGQTDNSNIVVLYSHPVDGQQGQFITSQGNLLVNSQTGMLEIRNGATLSTTTANQIVVNESHDSHVESIEMIQREIESHSAAEIKQEPVAQNEEHREDVQSVHEVSKEHAEEDTDNRKENEETAKEANEVEDSNEEVENEKAESENVEENKNVEENENVKEIENVEENEDKDRETTEDVTDGGDCTQEEPMEVEESIDNLCQSEEHSEDKEDPNESTEVPEAETNAKSVEETEQEKPSEDDGADIPPETANKSTDESSEEVFILNDPNAIQMIPCEEKEAHNDQEENEPEPMEVDGGISSEIIENSEKEAEEESDSIKNTEEETEKSHDEAREGGEEIPAEKSSEVENNEHNADEVDSNAVNNEEETPNNQSETSNSQFNDEDSQSSQETAQMQDTHIEPPSQLNLDKAILEDWDDTDSQQSEKQRSAMKEAVDNVNKLMDDWEEEDDDANDE